MRGACLPPLYVWIGRRLCSENMGGIKVLVSNFGLQLLLAIDCIHVSWHHAVSTERLLPERDMQRAEQRIEDYGVL